MQSSDTERHRAKTLAFVTSSNVDPISEWKGYALRITVFAIAFGIYVLFFRRKVVSSSSGDNTNRKIAVESDNPSTETAEEINSDDRSLLLARCEINDEICPICLAAPTIGVKASCGHLLCAECLANYRDVTMKSAPLPCPLCRAPLNSIALAVSSSKMLEPNAMMLTQDWIREYNNRNLLMRSVRPFPITRLVLFINILILFLIVGLLAVRLEVVAEI